MSPTNLLLPPSPPEALENAQEARRRVFEAWLGSLGGATRKAYERDLADFATWCGRPDAAAELLQLGKVAAEDLVVRYLGALRERELAPATVQRRRAALRSLVALAQVLGAVAWSLEARLPRSEQPRRAPPRGPTMLELQAMRRTALEQGGLKGARDAALLGCICMLRMREGALCGLRVSDYRDGDLWAVTKGHRDREHFAVPAALREELDAYLQLRGALPDEAPLFASHDPAQRAVGLTPDGLRQLVRELGRRAGLALPVSPHRLLHTATTDLLEATGGDRRAVQAWGHWERSETVDYYDDARQDLARKMAELAAERLGKPGDP
jgi:integrase/recombinase XerC